MYWQGQGLFDRMHGVSVPNIIFVVEVRTAVFYTSSMYLKVFSYLRHATRVWLYCTGPVKAGHIASKFDENLEDIRIQYQVECPKY